MKMRAIIIMFSTYTRIPMPQVRWDEKSTRYAVCAFPLAGVVISLLSLGLLRLSEMLKVPGAAQACLLIALPVIVTGGIHLDGLIDTADARSSYSDREKKLEILKDPHVGAFGIIRLALYLLLAFAALEILLCGSMTRRVLITALLIPVLSRICSGLTAELLPKARHSGMLSDMIGRKTERGKVTILSLQLIVCASVLLAADLISGGILLAAEGFLILYYRHMALTEFGGVTGDLAGWYLCMAELAGVWALAAAGWIR